MVKIRTDILPICETEDEAVIWVRLGNDGRMITVNKSESGDEEHP